MQCLAARRVLRSSMVIYLACGALQYVEDIYQRQ